MQGLLGAQMLWLFRLFSRQTDVFTRSIDAGGGAFEAYAQVPLTIVTELA